MSEQVSERDEYDDIPPMPPKIVRHMTAVSDERMAELQSSQRDRAAASMRVDRKGWTADQWMADADRLFNEEDGAVTSLVNGHVTHLLRYWTAHRGSLCAVCGSDIGCMNLCCPTRTFGPAGDPMTPPDEPTPDPMEGESLVNYAATVIKLQRELAALLARLATAEEALRPSDENVEIGAMAIHAGRAHELTEMYGPESGYARWEELGWEGCDETSRVSYRKQARYVIEALAARTAREGK